jgi:hypothetical protein
VPCAEIIERTGLPSIAANAILKRSKADNAGALCPNCHRKMHPLYAGVDRRALKKRIESREAPNPSN